MRCLPAVVVCSLALVPAAAPGQTPAAAGDAAPPDCWVPHSQVQPNPGDGGAPPTDAKSRLLAEKHVGADHLPRVARLPPCSAEPAREVRPPTAETGERILVLPAKP